MRVRPRSRRALTARRLRVHGAGLLVHGLVAARAEVHVVTSARRRAIRDDRYAGKRRRSQLAAQADQQKIADEKARELARRADEAARNDSRRERLRAKALRDIKGWTGEYRGPKPERGRRR